MALTLFPARSAIGEVTLKDGSKADVYMKTEFSRALADLLERVGGENGQSTTEIVNDITIIKADTDAISNELDNLELLDSSIQAIANLTEQIEDLRDQVTLLTQSLTGAGINQDLEINAAFVPPLTDWEHPGKIGEQTINSAKVTTISTLGGATFHTTTTALTNGAGVAAGTLLTAPAAGNPTKWIGINDNGTTRYIPAW